eukprot:TRINITY_DN827_c0_g1_i7.p3 TRINITY_DN827_c0_g1~~TRINITY_DN827_c0_g1_i7.p3  ORF type:complete len:298 (-),score=39.17 TRINITY_DN827_c0_g1_i7:152-1045(-)
MSQVQEVPKKAVLSYTGGKDCTLSLHLVHNQNNKYTNFQNIQVVLLVTFVPSHTTNPFRAHPLHIIKQAAEQLGIEHRTIIVAPPYIESYRQKIRELKEELGIEYFVTGDVEDVCDQFTKKAVAETGVELFPPLWQRPREELLSLLWENQIRSRITCVNLRSFGLDDTQLARVSRVLNQDQHTKQNDEQVNQDGTTTLSDNSEQNQNGITTLEDLSDQERKVVKLVGSVFDSNLCALIQEEGYGVDRVGEYGEFHTVVTECKLFSEKLDIGIVEDEIQRRVFKEVYCYIEFPETQVQ